jgi:hypothetical protein
VIPMASRWRPPDQGSYKLNMGFSVDSCLSLAGVGFLVRDADGTVRAAMKQRAAMGSVQLEESAVYLSMKEMRVSCVSV